MSVKGLIIALLAAIACFGVANAAESRTTSDVDSSRVAEYTQIFGGVVMGYTADDHNAQVWHEGDMAAGGDMAADKDDSGMAEGEKCGMHESCGCGCNSCHKSCGCNKCNSCHKSCGCNKCNSCGSKCGGGCSTCGHKDCGCGCPGAAYDCWGVWHADSYWHFDATRDSDVDMVLGDGGRGDHSFFGWGGW
jgi:hypothetical protein